MVAFRPILLVVEALVFCTWVQSSRLEGSMLIEKIVVVT